MEQQPPRKLLDQVRDALRLKHYSYRTEQSYVDWIRRYILFHKKRHPQDMGAAEVQSFLTYLAVERKVAASTQNQALSALLFLYREVLRVELPDLTNTVRAHKPKRLPTVLTRAEVTLLISCMTGMHQLMTKLLIRQRLAFDRVRALARQGCGFCPAHDRSERRQGRTRPRDSLARQPHQAGRPAYVPPLVCHAPARIRLRHAKRDGAGTPRSQGRQNDHDAKRTHILNRGGLAVRNPLD